ncbi:FAD-linked oxidase C-terminal domain-containing protein [Tardiphaga sp. OK245]|uniref:FAD-binding oxidoreductase n=1 Tax=Tardiphaga sp. OK245 TaxID=1855306 RepID=UPI0008A741CB|nr:FAD-linked oxidase C-terminal domain-containing protein [Tardiphaga sp. OK245]SEH88251.1 D-lactate dehydrogenase (cytochrome) [Tardiphaga sp. OK245]
MTSQQQKTRAESLDATLAELSATFGDRYSSSRAVREQHGCTVTWHENQAPDAVVFPRSTEEVAAIVRICAKHDTPIIPFGTGTCLEGHVNAPFGGVCVSTRELNQIIEVNAQDFDATVGAGVTRGALNDYIRDRGLFFPVDPGADASLGGMASTRASGTNAVRYGTMKDNVIAVTAVLPNGDVVRTATRAKKSSAGYDLTRLLVGAEGTLGLITDLTVRLHGIPENICAAVCNFPTVEAACEAAIMAIQVGIPIARVELLDEMQIRGCNLHSKLDMREAPTLFLEFHGTSASVEEQAQMFADIAKGAGCGAFAWATKPEERARLWKARHDSYWGQLALRPGAKTFATDVCVPLSRLAESVVAAQKDVAESGLVCCILGHIGDGNFHCAPLVMMDDPEEVARARAFAERVVMRALEVGGTCTGEHGIGQDKRKYLEREHGATTVNAMRTIKLAMDPRNIFNPGKVLPPHAFA